MLGYAVLSPFGFDSFGLPAENAAIKTGDPPPDLHRRPDRRAEGVAHLARGRLRLAPGDPQPRPRVHPVEPGHLPAALGAGLAYRANAPVNWCPGCQTVLANEQVLADGTCERSGDLVVKRDLEQWFFRITAYADELLAGLDDLEWPERVKTMQRNWIGRSEGAEFDLAVVGRTADATAGAPGVHHPARHVVRDDLRRRGPRASSGRRADHPGAPGRGRRAARRARPPPS